MRTTFLLICALLSLQVSLAQQITRLDGSSVQASTLTTQLQAIVDKAQIAGLSVVLLNGDKMTYRHTFGWANKPQNQPLNDSTAMYAASFTKPLSTYLFLKLVEAGTFALDTPVVSYLKKPIGEYEKWKELAAYPAFNRVTPRMLLSHRSGLPVVRYVYGGKLSLIAPPDSTFYYSNEGFNLLGMMVEERTGKPLRELGNEFVFGPLGMTHSSYIWEPRFEPNHAIGHTKTSELVELERRKSPRAAGSMTTTATDYSRFVAAVMQRRGLPDRLFAEMLSPQIKIRSERGFGPKRDAPTTQNDAMQLAWGLGFCLFNSPHGRAFLHGGHDTGWQNYAVCYPDKKVAVVLMSNSSNFEPVAADILRLTIGDTASPLTWFGYYDNNE